jgi:acyl-CoA synthetase (AMP-forming)/AMP-acid ligase II
MSSSSPRPTSRSPRAPAPELDAAGPGDPAMVMCTSGTTGAAKGAALSHQNLLAGAESARLAWGWTPEDRLILALPLCHIHGLGVGLHGALLSGGSAELQDRFDVESVLGAATDGATMFFGVPTMYERLAEAEGVARLGALRLCVSGSAPLNADLHARFAERSGQVVLERYGMTETLVLVSNPLNGERRAGTVGFPLPGVDLRLDEETGEILVRGPSVFAGYRDLPDVNATAFTDGWFRTGDIGEVDGGYLRIVGRAKELIITGGYNVYPREVEDVLRAFAGVRDAAVVGTPSDEWGETVTAYVEGSAQLDLDALSVWAAGELTAIQAAPARVPGRRAAPEPAGQGGEGAAGPAGLEVDEDCLAGHGVVEAERQQPGRLGVAGLGRRDVGAHPPCSGVTPGRIPAAASTRWGSRVVGQLRPYAATSCRALPARRMFSAALTSAWASCPQF